MRPSLLAWILLGLCLRLLRVISRWDELTLAYAAYAEPIAGALGRGELLRAATTWVGLHPPLAGLVQGVYELLLPMPLVWMLTSALLSAAAVALVGRAGGPLAAAVLATSPLQIADAAEVNNYPLAAFGLALVLAASRASWPRLAAAATLASWSHVLAAAGAGGVVAWRLAQGEEPRGQRLRLVAASLLGVLPVLVGALRRAGEPGTFTQPELVLSDWLGRVAASVGPEGLVLGGIAVLGLRSVRAAAWAPISLVLVLSLALGAAAPHQRPYLGLLGPAAALALASFVEARQGGARRLLVGGVTVLCLLRGGRLAFDELQRVAAIAEDLRRPRALDQALAESRPGDSLWVVVPALEPDDDKTATGPLMWRTPPWSWMPIARPVAFEYSNPQYGQPRAFRGRTLHSSTELQAQAFDHVAAAALRKGRMLVVLADHGPATGLVARVERVLRPYSWQVEEIGEDRGLGRDRLYRLDGLREGSP